MALSEPPRPRPGMTAEEKFENAQRALEWQLALAEARRMQPRPAPPRPALQGSLPPTSRRALEEQLMPSVPKDLNGRFFCSHFGHSPSGSVCVARQEENPETAELFYCTRGLCEQGKAVAKACRVEVKRWVVRQHPPPVASSGGHFQHRRATSGVLATPARETGPRIPSASERPPEVRETPAWKAGEERIQGLVPAKLAPSARVAPAKARRPAPVPEPSVEELVNQIEVPVDQVELEPTPVEQGSLTEEQVHRVVGPGPWKVRPLAKGERVAFKPGLRLTFVRTSTPATPAPASVAWSNPIDIPMAPRKPLDLPPDPLVSPPAPAQPEKDALMVAVTKDSLTPEVKLCLRDKKLRNKEVKLRPNNESGICSNCRVELGGSDAVARWLAENAEASGSGTPAPAPQKRAAPVRRPAPSQLEMPGTPAPAAMPDFRTAPNTFLLACLKQIKGEVQRRASELAELTKAVSEFSTLE